MASGDTLSRFFPDDNEPPSTDFATRDTRNGHPVLDFDQGATLESAIFSDVMPQNYAAGGVTVYLSFSADGITTGDVDWDVAFERFSSEVQDIDADGFAAANSVDNSGVPTGASGHVKTVSVAFTNGADMDSVVAGDNFRIKVTRDSASDTAAADIELHSVEIRET